MDLILKRIYQSSILLLVLSFVSLSGVNQLVKADFHYEIILDDSRGIVELQEIESPTITITVNTKEPKAQVLLRASDIVQIANTLPSAVIELKTEWSSFILPVNMMDYAAWVNKHRIDLSNLFLQMTIEKVEDAEQIEAWKARLGEAALVSPLIRFTTSLVAHGEKIELTDYNGKYVSRTLQFPVQAVSSDLTAISLDEVTQRFSFVPALFHMMDNQTAATIQAPHDSLYGVVRFHKSFADLGHHLDKQDIELLASKHVIQGITSTRFEPEAEITRAQFISLLVRALGLREAPDLEAAFTDISTNDWYAGAVRAAVRAGIVKGYADATFGAMQPILCEQMAVMLANALRFTNRIVNLRERADLLLADFSDSELISRWAVPAVEQVVETGIMTGRTKANFAPKDHMTRAEAAGVLKRFMQFVHFID
jgi:pectate disaccharide-lyase